MGCLAAPIRNNSGKAVAAISVTGIVDQILGDMRPEIINSVKKAARDISIMMGFIE